ncbi:hypothetical protein V6N13_147308 [Hibiscus sabdariffa]
MRHQNVDYGSVDSNGKGYPTGLGDQSKLLKANPNTLPLLRFSNFPDIRNLINLHLSLPLSFTFSLPKQLSFQSFHSFPCYPFISKEMKGMQGRRFLKKLKCNPIKFNTSKPGLLFHQHTFSNQSCKTNNVKDRKDDEPEVDVEHPCLTDFEEKCPPGGENAVVFYTTSLRGIRKTFEDCSSIRFLLDSFKVSVHERDVSMDMGFREELWNILGGRVIPPKLFIGGRYIGGAGEAVGLHEQGKLKKLLEEIPSSGIPNNVCSCCGNLRFLVCSNCHGSRKVYEEKGGDDHHHHEFCLKKCNDCNENGLVRCSFCC